MTSEKFPITTERLKTFVLLGHSNADGWSGSSPMIAHNNHLGSTALPRVHPEDDYFKNIYVFTSDIPWALSGGTPVASLISNGEWLEMTLSNPQSWQAEHPFPSPYRYPNVRGSCYPNWAHDASPPGSELFTNRSGHGGGTHVGIELPFSYHWLHHWQDQVGMVKLALSSTLFLRSERFGATTPIASALWFDAAGYSTTFSPNEPGRPDTTVDPADGFFGWWEPYNFFDWAPATDRLYGLWFDKMTGAAAALPAGTKMDVRLVIPWFGENDALTKSLAILQSAFKPAVVAFIKRIRRDIRENDWTTLAEEEIAIVWPKLSGGYNNGTENTVDFCNSVLDEIEADDPFFKTVEPNNWSLLSDEGYSYGIPAANTHFGPQGYVQAAYDVYAAFQDIEVEPYDSLDTSELVDVQTVMDEVRTYYTRARVSTDVEDEPLLQHINGAFQHIANLIGDNAWFWRNRKELDLTAGPNTPTTLPKYVHRLLKIEVPGDITRAVPFEQTGFVDGGKLQVLIKERVSGTYTVHYITQPRRMTGAGQLVKMPFQMIEWLVVETCRRLARSSSNMALQATLEGEARQIMTDCMRNMGAMQRSRNDRLQKQLRLPNPRLRRRTRSFGADNG